jgi:hypothetical protein
MLVHEEVIVAAVVDIDVAGPVAPVLVGLEEFVLHRRMCLFAARVLVELPV